MRKQRDDALDMVTSIRDKKHSLEEKAAQLVGVTRQRICFFYYCSE